MHSRVQMRARSTSLFRRSISHFLTLGAWVCVSLCVFLGGPVVLVGALFGGLLGGLWLLAMGTIAFWVCVVASIAHTPKEWPWLRQHPAWQWLWRLLLGWEGHDKGYGLDQEQEPRIIAYYPHGLMCFGLTVGWMTGPLSPRVRVAVHSGLFYVPIIRTLIGWGGCIKATQEEMTRVLYVERRSVAVCPGGIADIMCSGTEVVKRDGFVRLACNPETRIPLIPAWSHQERNQYGWIVIIPWGRWWNGLLPRAPEPMRILMGDPVNLGEPDSTGTMDVEGAKAAYYIALAELSKRRRMIEVD